MVLSLCGCRAGLLSRSILTKVPVRSGYIILVPEIGEDLPDTNPLLTQNGLPEFNNITIENCMAAVGKQTLEFEANVHKIEANLSEKPPSDIFKEVFDSLEEVGSPLDTTWGLSKTLYLGNSTLMPTKSYMAIHDRAKRARAVKFNSPMIYQAVCNELKDEKSVKSKWSEEQKRVLNKFSLEGKLNGLSLDTNKRDALYANLTKLAEERTKFRQKAEMATKRFKHEFSDPQIARSFPEDILSAMATVPSNPHKGPWTITLQPHLYVPFMECCPDREIRWNVWQAMVSRGSGYSDRELETSTHIEQIRSLRRDQAKLLGYESYADMSMETKMASSVQHVHSLISQLHEHAAPAQQRELESLTMFAQESGFGHDRLELWDVPYWRRKQRQVLFGFVEADYRHYFPLDNVLNGLWSLCNKLFGVDIKQRIGADAASTWHKDVRLFDVFDSGAGVEPIGSFYLDPYVRSGEKPRLTQPNASSASWMVGIQSGSGVTQSKPLAALVFNLPSPSVTQPSLLSLKDVHTLFHRTGTVLQHILSKVRYGEVAGLSNVEWDVVEAGGHVLGHWLLDRRTVVDGLSCHWQTGEKLPEKMWDGMFAVHKHAAGLDLCRELYLSAIDLALYSSKNDFWLDLVKVNWPQYRPFPLTKQDSHLTSFSPIFSEEWAAAYYSHIWARVVAADIYGAFHEVGADDAKIGEVGRRYKDTFLALGGSCDPNTVFRRFRGRDPTPKALLKSLAFKAPSAERLAPTSTPITAATAPDGVVSP